jgi:hypothetical protein
MKQLTIGDKVFNFEGAEHIVVEFTDEGDKLDFQALFEKGVRGKYKIMLEKIDGTT